VAYDKLCCLHEQRLSIKDSQTREIEEAEAIMKIATDRVKALKLSSKLKLLNFQSVSSSVPEIEKRRNENDDDLLSIEKDDNDDDENDEFHDAE
jgi:hypothetical protein